MSGMVFNPTPEEQFARHRQRIARCLAAIEKEQHKARPDADTIASFQAEVDRRKHEVQQLTGA